MHCSRFIIVFSSLLIYLLPGGLDAVTIESNEPSWRPSPTGAALRSLAFPGWGQMYAGSPLKAVIYSGIEQGFIYGVYWQHKLYQHYYSIYQYHDSIHQYYDSLPDSHPDSLENKRLADFNKELADYNERLANPYKNDRNRMAWYLTAAIILSVMDAYVEAHLYGFDVSDDLSGSGGRHDSVRSINYALSGFPGGGIALNIFWRIP